MAIIPEVLVHKRIHDRNVSLHSTRAVVYNQDLLRIAKQSIDRKRHQKAERGRGVDGQPLISVIIPVYNGERYLAEAIESAFAQNYEPMEVIVVDDGSTDGSAQVAARFGNRIYYAYQPNRGVSAARNAGLRIAHGNLIAFLDADDLWTPDKLKLQLTYLANNPEVGVVLGHTQMLRECVTPEGMSRFEKAFDPCVFLVVGSSLARRGVFEQVGWFDETMPQSEDVDWFMRARELGVVMIVLKEVTLLYRQHQQNITREPSARDRHFAQALKKSLDRRRKQGGGAADMLPGLTYLDDPRADKS